MYDEGVVPEVHEYEEDEGTARAMQEFYDADREAFIHMINGILWDQDFHEHVDDQARSMGYEEHTYRKYVLRTVNYIPIKDQNYPVFTVSDRLTL